MIEAVIELGTKMAVYFAREIPNDNEAFTFAMRYVLDPEMTFYRQFGVTDSSPSSIVELFEYNHSIAMHCS